MYDLITLGSATRDVFLMSRAMHPHRSKDALTHLEACFPFGAKIGVDEIHFSTGGGATNSAATFARLGKFKVAAITRLGRDRAGQDILEALRQDHVDTRFVQRDPQKQTAYAAILSPGGEVGERTILVYRGASKKIEHRQIPWSELKARWFYVSSLGGDFILLKKLFKHAKKISAQVAFNPGGQELSRPSVMASAMKPFLYWLILNREEASKLTGVPHISLKKLLTSLSNFAPRVIMTDGPRGAYAVIRRHPERSEGSPTPVGSPSREILRSVQNDFAAYYVPSVGHKPKNLTGAGDAFGSGFVTGWIKSRGSIEEALRVAAINADSVVQHVGAKVGILKKYPSQNQMKKLPIKIFHL